MSDLPADSNANGTAQPANDPPAPPISDPTPYKESKSKRLKRYCNRNLPKTPIWIEAACALALVVITGMYTHYAGGQLRAMRGQLGEIIKQYPELQKSAEAAKSAASTADATLKSSQKSFEIDQRPYLIIAEGPQFNEPILVANEPITANVTFKNVGRTPAVKEVGNVSLVPYHPLKKTDPQGLKNYISFIESEFGKLRAKNETGRKSFEKLKEISGGQDVAPGGGFFVTNQETLLLSAPELSLVRTGEITLFYIGIVTYTDPFEGSHKTEFCHQYFGTQPKIWHICDVHNTIR